MKLSRKAVVATGAALGLNPLLRTRGGAAEYTFKVGIPVPPTHPMTVRTLEAARAIETHSDGRFQLQVFPNSQLGNDSAMLSQVRVGAVQLFATAGTNLSGVVPLTAMESLAFVFPTLERALVAMDSPFGGAIRTAIRRAGLFTFDKVCASGMHQITNYDRPIVTPDDVRGFKVRVSLTPTEIDLFKALGGSPQPMSLSETYTALQTHLVAGSALPIASIEASRIYEVQKYLSLTGHIFTSITVVGNNDAIEALPRNLRELMVQAFEAAAMRERADIIASETALVGTLTKQGMIANRPNPAPFREAVKKAGLFAQWRSQFGAEAWTLLERSVGSLE